MKTIQDYIKREYPTMDEFRHDWTYGSMDIIQDLMDLGISKDESESISIVNSVL